MWVTIGSGEGKGMSVRVEGERFVVGTGAECQLMVGDPQVAPLHAYFEVTEGGKVELHDLGSDSGTFVNGERVDGSRRIEGGEEIRIGETLLVPSVEAPAEEARHRAEATEGQDPAAPAVRVRTEEGRTVEVVTASEGEAVEVVPVGEHRRLRERIGRATVLAAGAALVAIAALIVFLATRGGSPSTADIVKYAKPRTVLVKAKLDVRHGATGSGFVLDAANGLVVTNFHVINGGREIFVGVNGELRQATVYSAAPCDDLAVLKAADGSGMKNFPLGSQSEVSQGDRVVAVGFPANASLDDALTSTEGVVSVVRTAFRAPSPEAPPYSDALQTDAALNPGNSGGPLIDDRKHVVGVNAAALTQIGHAAVQNESYAIGIDRAKQVLVTLRQGRSQGYAGFGIAPPPRKVAAGLLAVPQPGAATGGAATAGGALVVAINGTPLRPSFESYCNAVRDIRSGQTAVLTVLGRGGHPHQVPVRFQ